MYFCTIRKIDGSTSSWILEKSCVECHSEIKTKGDLRLDNIKWPVKSEEEAEKWYQVLDAIHLEEMPPEEEEQLSIEDKKYFLDTLNSNLGRLKFKMLKPQPRLMTGEEFKLTVSDLLDIDNKFLDPGRYIPKLAVATKYDTHSKDQIFSLEAIDEFVDGALGSVFYKIDPKAKPESQKKVFSTANIKMGGHQGITEANKYFELRYKWHSNKTYLKWTVEHDGFYEFEFDAEAKGLKASGIKDFDKLTERFRNEENHELHLLGHRTEILPGLNPSYFFVDQIPIKAKRNIYRKRVYLEKGHRIHLELGTGPNYGAVKKGFKQKLVKNDKSYPGPGIRIYDVKVKGPMIEAWPSPTINFYFGGDYTLRE